MHKLGLQSSLLLILLISQFVILVEVYFVFDLEILKSLRIIVTLDNFYHKQYQGSCVKINIL